MDGTYKILYVVLLFLPILVHFLWEGPIFSLILVLVFTYALAQRVFKNQAFLLVLSLVLFTWTLTFLHHSLGETALTGQESTFYLEVDMNTLKTDGDRLRFHGQVLEADGKKIREKLAVTYRMESLEEKEVLGKADFSVPLLVEGTLTEPVTHKNFHQFSYKTYLKRRKVNKVLEAQSLQFFNSGQRLRGLSWLRHHVLKNIAHDLPPLTGAYVRSLLFADTSALDEGVLSTYRRLGIIHVLSISGLHISLMAQNLDAFFRRWGVTLETIPYVIGLLLLAYGFLTAWPPGVFRAVFHYIFQEANKKAGHPFSALDTLALTLFVSLCINPQQIFEAGFQLSYVLSAALICLQRHHRLDKYPGWVQDWQKSALLTLLSLPILSHHFFEIPVWSLLMNIVFVPFITHALMPGLFLAFLLWLLFPAWGFPQVFFISLESLISLYHGILQAFGRLPFLTLVTGRLSLIPVLILLLGLLFFIYIYDRPQPMGRIQVLVCGLLILGPLLSKTWPLKDEILAIDVGQGDSFLVRKAWPSTNILIDTGGSFNFESEEWRKRSEPFSIGSDILVPVLKSEGIQHLDALILTHSDWDHLGALQDLLAEIEVQEIISTRLVFESENFIRQYQALDKPPRLLVLGDRLPHLEDSRVIWPQLSTNNWNPNDASLVFYARIGKDWWLFTGDISEAIEKELAGQGRWGPVAGLKVAHHGSASSTSQDFLDQVKPRYALISVGENNRYGHPSPSVIERLEKGKAEILRTDDLGAIRMTYWPLSDTPAIETVKGKREP